MIDIYDIRLLELWLGLAMTQGTDVIKVRVGPEPNQWIIWCDDTKGGKP